MGQLCCGRAGVGINTVVVSENTTSDMIHLGLEPCVHHTCLHCGFWTKLLKFSENQLLHRQPEETAIHPSFRVVIQVKCTETPINVIPVCLSKRKSTLNIRCKDWCWFSNTLATWCEELTHWKRPWCWERSRQKEKRVAKDEMVRKHHWLHGHKLEQTPGESGRQGSLVAAVQCGKESDRT